MSLIREVINNNKTDLKPIWIMRQAGRYLPEFREIRKNNTDFIKLCLNENLSSEIKANKVSQKNLKAIVIGADSVIDLEGELISKPKNRDDALKILKKLNGKKHNLISSVCISKNGSMIWNYTDKASLFMKKFNNTEMKEYLSSISDEDLYAYNVYQIEGEGRKLFLDIEGDENTIMGLPIKKIKEYLNNYK